MKFYLAFLLGTLLTFSCKEKEIKMKLSTRSIDLGIIGVNDITECGFTIFNKGRDPLEILDYTCSCECTIPEIISNQVVQPTDSLQVTMRVHPNAGDIGATKHVICTFKTNADSTFSHINILYTAQ